MLIDSEERQQWTAAGVLDVCRAGLLWIDWSDRRDSSAIQCKC